MGFDEGHIEFDHENLVYYAGQVIHGKVVFNQQNFKTFRGLFVKLKGFCDVHWTTNHERRVNDRTEHYSVEHTSHEVYCEQKVFLAGGSEGEAHLNPGHYEFPFQMLLPGHCPSSFEGSNGHIRYEVKAIVDRAFKFDQEKCTRLTVVNQKDLNLEPYCKEPMIFEFEDTYCCWCMSVGTSEVTVKLPQSGYCPGQTIHFELNCENKSNVELEIIEFRLVENRKFIAEHNHETRNENREIAKLRKGPIPGNTTRNWNLEMDIPNMDLYNVEACKYIQINHDFEVKVATSGCHTDTDGSRRIVLGHIPLREFGEGPPPGDVVPTINQPVQQGYPPVSNQYQQNASPCYNSNSPYPNPGQQQPFPTPNSVHQPFPNPPYPGGNMPYPSPQTPGFPSVTASPYPTGNSPFPSPNPPYPAAPGQLPSVSPYPVGPDPYVPVPSQPGFALGFENRDPSSSPLPQPQLPVSPVTSQMPYPPNPSGSPFVTASAPEPSTPDLDGKVHSSPFNPEIKN